MAAAIAAFKTAGAINKDYSVSVKNVSSLWAWLKIPISHVLPKFSHIHATPTHSRHQAVITLRILSDSFHSTPGP